MWIWVLGLYWGNKGNDWDSRWEATARKSSSFYKGTLLLSWKSCSLLLVGLAKGNPDWIWKGLALGIKKLVIIGPNFLSSLALDIPESAISIGRAISSRALGIKRCWLEMEECWISLISSLLNHFIQLISRVSTIQLFYEVPAYFEFGFKLLHFPWYEMNSSLCLLGIALPCLLDTNPFLQGLQYHINRCHTVTSSWDSFQKLVTGTKPLHSEDGTLTNTLDIRGSLNRLLNISTARIPGSNEKKKHPLGLSYQTICSGRLCQSQAKE